jgi:hypothetical protein
MEENMAHANAQRADSDDQQSDESRRGGRPLVDKFQEGPFQVSIWQNPCSRATSAPPRWADAPKDKEGQFQTSHSYSASDLDHLEKEARARITRWQEENKSPEGQVR